MYLLADSGSGRLDNTEQMQTRRSGRRSHVTVTRTILAVWTASVSLS